MPVSFKGTGVALVTPFSSYAIDKPAIQKLVNHVIEGGVNYCIVLGSTGEASTISTKEQRQLTDWVIQAVDGRVPIVAGNFGMNDTHALCTKLKEWNFDGIDGILMSQPAYNKPTQEGLYQHYLAAGDCAPRPVIIYNIPGRSACNIHWETTLRLAQSGRPFVAIKEASNDLIQIQQIIQDRPKEFLVLSGDDQHTLAIMACGGEGVISVASNAFPQEFTTLVNAMLAGDLVKARRYNSILIDIHKWLYIEGNPAGIKGALSELCICSDEVRLPLVPLSATNRKQLVAEMERIRAKVLV